LRFNGVGVREPKTWNQQNKLKNGNEDSKTMKNSMKAYQSAAVLLMLCIVSLVGMLLRSNPQQATALPKTLPPIEVFYSPHGGCTDAVVREIAAAQKSILVQAYSFTSAPIAEALVAAHRRGVVVRVILDDSQESDKNSSAGILLHGGVPPMIDAEHAIAHNKIMVIDDAVVITGSFNFTMAAEKSNAENLLVIRSPELAATYTANWQNHLAHSREYTGEKHAAEHSTSSHRRHDAQ
jgi:phosphatidylserine/phosphatidylglycerophosphate/cardiolipin synthase-like enzyme